MAKKTKIPNYAWLVLAIAVVIGLLAMTSGDSEALAKFYASKVMPTTGKCIGTTTCPLNTTKSTCLSLGCNWTNINYTVGSYCKGTRPCSIFTTATACKSATGCNWTITKTNATNITNATLPVKPSFQTPY